MACILFCVKFEGGLSLSFRGNRRSYYKKGEFENRKFSTRHIFKLSNAAIGHWCKSGTWSHWLVAWSNAVIPEQVAAMHVYISTIVNEIDLHKERGGACTFERKAHTRYFKLRRKSAQGANFFVHSGKGKGIKHAALFYLLYNKWNRVHSTLTCLHL